MNYVQNTLKQFFDKNINRDVSIDRTNPVLITIAAYVLIYDVRRFVSILKIMY